MQSGEYTAIHQEEELLGDDPILVDLVRDDFHLIYKQGRLKNKYSDQTLNKVTLPQYSSHLSPYHKMPFSTIYYGGFFFLFLFSFTNYTVLAFVLWGI